jgi:hypothetical protein
MSSNRNIDAIPQGTEFHASRPRDEPLTTHGHAPGVKASPADRAPEFSAETYPAGTAPKEHTYQPQTQSEVPGQAMNPDTHSEAFTSAESTLPGATSQSVYNQTDFGRPNQGQTQREIRHDGKSGRKKERSGLEGLASTGIDSVRAKGADLGPGIERGMRGKGSDDYPAAEERVPESAESVAAEFTRSR